MQIWKKNSNWIPQGDRQTRSFDSGLVLLQQTFIAPTGTPASSAFALGAAFPGNTAPCIDGAFIYPAPTYSETGNGFTTCTVSAYGRWRTEPSVQRQKIFSSINVFLQINDSFTNNNTTSRVNFQLSNQPVLDNGNTSYFLEILTDKIVVKFVSPKNANIPLTPNQSLLRIYNRKGEIIPNPITPLQFQQTIGGSIPTKYGYVYGQNSGLIDTIEDRTFTLNTVDFSNVQISRPFYLELVLSACDSADFGNWEEHTAIYEPKHNNSSLGLEFFLVSKT